MVPMVTGFELLHAAFGAAPDCAVETAKARTAVSPRIAASRRLFIPAPFTTSEVRRIARTHADCKSCAVWGLDVGRRSKLETFDADEAAVDVGDRRAAGERHRPLELEPQDLEHARHARLARDGEAVHVRLADHDGAGAERDGLEDVPAALDAAVDVDLDAAANRFDDLRER